jgi:hypothetical protein
VTVALKLSEVIVDAVIAKLVNGAAARCAAINMEKDDGIVVEAPGQADIIPFGSPAGPVQKAPCYVITAPFGTSPVYRGDGPHAFDYIEQVAVMILEEDPDRQRVGRKLLRQQRAIIETLWDDPPREALAGSAYTLQPVRHIAGPTFEPTSDVSMWRSYMIQVFTAQQQEGE